MTEQVEYLTLDDLVELAILLMGEPPPIRDLGLLGSAVARPQAAAFGEDAYPDIWTKAAGLFQSLSKNHALIDGNKRLSWLAAAVFLELNGVAASGADNDAVYEIAMEAAAGDHSVEQIASMLRATLPAA